MKICRKCKSEFCGIRCKACNSAYHAAYKTANKEKISKLAAIRYAANPEKFAARNSAYKAANPEKIYSVTPESKARSDNKRRALKLGIGGSLSSGLFDRLFKLQRGKCPACKGKLSRTNPRSHMDHIVPLALNGANEDSNIQLLCNKCNCSKGSKHSIDFMQKKGFLL